MISETKIDDFFVLFFFFRDFPKHRFDIFYKLEKSLSLNKGSILLLSQKLFPHKVAQQKILIQSCYIELNLHNGKCVINCL